MHKRVGIFISGGGSNMRALVEDMIGDHTARPAVVVSNNADSGGIAWARARGIAIQLIGFLYITPFFVAALMWISGARKWKQILIISAGSTVGIYLFFQKVFRVLLPQGTLF